MGEEKREESERDLMREYALLAGLRSEGHRDYHNMSLVYLSAISILITGGGILQSGIIGNQISPIGYLISIILSVVGIFLCIQMALAQGIFRTWNSYLEEKLMQIEESKNWKWHRVFLGIYAIKGGKKDEEKEKTASSKFIPSLAVKYRDKWWAGRMKLLPTVFVSVFFALIFLIIFKISEQYFIFEPLSNWRFIFVSVSMLLVAYIAVYVCRFLWRIAKSTWI
jgi:hypothetical protein